MISINDLAVASSYGAVMVIVHTKRAGQTNLQQVVFSSKNPGSQYTSFVDGAHFSIGPEDAVYLQISYGIRVPCGRICYGLIGAVLAIIVILCVIIFASHPKLVQMSVLFSILEVLSHDNSVCRRTSGRESAYSLYEPTISINLLVVTVLVTDYM